MLIKSIRLKNIRSYTDSLIEFPKGSSLLSGDIGTGKSSILIGIEFALFGTKKAALSSSSLLRNGAKSGSVELCFEIENKDVIIGRFLKKTNAGIKQENGFIIINGIKTEFSPTELRTRVYEILGYPADMLGKGDDLIYRFTVYTPQEEMKSILFKDSEERVQTLRKVFDIDKYKRITNNASIVSKKMREEIRILDAKSEGMNEKIRQSSELKEKVSAIKKRMSEIKKSEENKQTMIYKTNKELSDIEDEMKKINDSAKEIEISKIRIKDKENIILKKTQNISDIEKNHSNISSRLEILKKAVELKNIDNYQDYKEDIERNIDKERIEIESVIKSAQSDKKKISDAIAFYNKKINENELQSTESGKKISLINLKKQKIPELSDSIKNKDKIFDDINNINLETARINAFEIQLIKTLEELKKSLNNISSLKDCPLCLQKVDNNHKHNITEDLNKKIGLINQDLQKSQEKLKNKNQEKTCLKIQYDDILKKERELQIIEKEISSESLIINDLSNRKKESLEYSEQIKKSEIELQKKLELDLNSLKIRSEDLSKKLEAIRNIKIFNLELSQLETRKTLEEKLIREIDEEIIKINEKIDSLKPFLENLNSVSQKILEKKKEQEKNLEDLKSLEIDRAKIESESLSIQSIIDNLEIEIKEKQRAITKKNILSVNQEWMQKQFIPLIDNIEKHIMSRIHGEFSELFNKWFSLLVEDENVQVRLDDEFTPILEQNNYETELSNLSGGEKTSLALAYRLALNKVVNDIVSNIKTKNIIILDEPTDGFSAEQLDKLKDVIHELNMNQIIIVSHEHKIETFVDNLIKVSKDQHISKIDYNNY